MGVLDSLRNLLGRGPAQPDPEALAREEELKARLRERCARFRRLLSANKAALEGMSEAEALLSGGHPFGMDAVRALGTRVGASVYQMVRELNALSGNAYPELNDAFRRVHASMEACLPRREHEEDVPLILPLADIRLQHMPLVGGKMANLGEVAANVGMDVPEGFAVTVAAYERFMLHNGLRDAINQRIQSTDLESLDAVFSLSASLQQLVQGASLPPELESALEEAVADMQRRLGPDLRLALRSSAVGEDGLGVTFAGQYRSELDVLPEEACDVWKEIIASKYSVTAMSYRFQRGIPDEAAPMCVGVLSMVRAEAGGVAYSRDPVAARQGREQVTLNAVPGLPQAVVDGGMTPDVFTFSRTNPPELLERQIAVKPFRLDCAPGCAQGVRRTPLSPEEGARACINDGQALHLARLALALEEFYNEPQDVEWALEMRDGASCLVVLQSRPLSESGDMAEAGRADPLPDSIPSSAILAQGGMTVSGGAAAGPLFVARKDADMLSFPRGGILVVERAHPRWAPLLPQAAAMISETGGMAGHLASVAREYGLPALFSLPDACSLLADGGMATLDADRAVVLRGEYPELLAGHEKPRNLMQGSPVQETLRSMAEYMTPLHLLDPESPEFAPASCRSFHDITRFCHEKAVELMFGENADVDQRAGKQLKAGVKLQYWVVDMDDGFSRPVTGPVVDLRDIACEPMQALWAGMTAVPWAGPPSSGAAGFMSVVFESAMNKDLESTAPAVMAEKNFFIISSKYMILQARYGYHFCTVECLAGDNRHENFVSFQFKGGAADAQRRERRARLIAELLEAEGFRVDVRKDALFAVAEGYDKEETLLRVRILGYLLMHTRQIDMIMLEEARVAAYRTKFEQDIAGLKAK